MLVNTAMDVAATGTDGVACGRSNVSRITAPRRGATALTGDLNVETALRRIVAECRAEMSKYRTVVLTTRQPIGIHQTRVALRRLRAGIGLFRDVVSDAELHAIASEARWLAGECAPARDLHVLLAEIGPDAPQRVSRVGARLARERLLRARRALGGARFAEFDRRLERFVLTPPPAGGETLKAFGRRALDAHQAKMRRRGRKLSRLKAADLHRLRIAVKKLRYAATFLGPIFEPSAAIAYIDATESLQNALGTLNDRTVGAKVLADIAEAARPSDRVQRPCKRLTRRLKGGAKHDKRRLKQAWKAFKKAAPFWCGSS